MSPSDRVKWLQLTVLSPTRGWTLAREVQYKMIPSDNHILILKSSYLTVGEINFRLAKLVRNNTVS